MASHAQITKNLNDVHGAWGQLQALLSSWLPTSAATVNGFTRAIARQHRRF